MHSFFNNKNELPLFRRKQRDQNENFGCCSPCSVLGGGEDANELGGENGNG